MDESLLDAVLELLRARLGTDFSGYVRPTIRRRVLNRMLSSRIVDMARYLELLRTVPEEPELLLECLTIKVSRFFRDEAVFALLRRSALPDLTSRAPGKGLLCWSAGCGNGEEAYSLALLLAELQDAEAARRSRVYGSDIDGRALQKARRGRYTRPVLQELPAELLRCYFTPDAQGSCYDLRDRVRSRVRFVQHDLTQTDRAPDGRRFGLICCRNTLIYFQRPVQQRVLRLLYTSLAPGGYLCLGEAEWLSPELEPLFEIVDRRARLFRAREQPGDDTPARGAR